jgi:tetratricopeptide (TPR) repeat protein
MAHYTIILGEVAKADDFARKAIASDSRVLLPQFNFALGEADLGRDEIALRATRMALKTASAGDPDIGEPDFTQSVLSLRLEIAKLAGDYIAARDLAGQRQAFNDLENGREDEMQACASLHDVACFRAAAASLSLQSDDAARLVQIGSLQQARVALGWWDAVMKAAPAFHASLPKNPFMKGWLVLSDAPLQALAAAHLGDTKRAHALIDPMRMDCVLCLRFRGQIDAVDRNWNGAAYWFSRAARVAPSVPFPDTDWGQMLLAEGDYDGAIAKFQSAHTKGPHFADPLELWGDALMQKNRSDLALAKFAEADKYAPHWGRLHLEWGKALVYAGKPAGANKQFAIASHLELSASDAATLARMRGTHV